MMQRGETQQAFPFPLLLLAAIVVSALLLAVLLYQQQRGDAGLAGRIVSGSSGCSDSDANSWNGGLNYTLRGEVQASQGMFRDTCTGSQLLSEYLCENAAPKSVQYPCGALGCLFGACATKEYAAEVSNALRPIAYWSLNRDTAGVGAWSVFDEGGKYNGTARDGATLLANGVGGKAAHFEGVKEYVRVNQSNELNLAGQPLTLVFWIRGPLTPNTVPIAKMDAPTSMKGWSVYVSSPRELQLKIGNGNDFRILNVTFEDANQWHQVAFAISRTGISSAYLDGRRVSTKVYQAGAGGMFVEDASSSVSGIFAGQELSNDYPLHIGANTASYGEHAASHFFRGEIDDILILRRVLRVDELQSLYEFQRLFVGGQTGGGQGAQPAHVRRIAEYSFEEQSWSGTGKEVRDAVGVFNGSTRNGANTAAAGALGRAASFDGVDDAVVVSGERMPQLQKFTISLWAKAAQLAGGVRDPVGSWISRRESFVFGAERDGKAVLYVNVNGAYVAAASAPGLVRVGEWQHWVATFNGSALLVYLNGTLAVQTHLLQAGNAAAGGDVYLGHDFLRAAGQQERFFNGSLDEVIVYEQAFTPSEVQQIYSAQQLQRQQPLLQQAISIEQCRVIDKPGVYKLTQRLTVTDTCFSILADHVVFDGDGKSVRFSENAGQGKVTYGVYAAGRTNLTLRNLVIDRFTQGIFLSASKNVTLDHVTIRRTGGSALVLNQSAGIEVKDSEFSVSGEHGVAFLGTQNSTMRDSLISASTRYGLYLAENAIDNVFTRLTFMDNAAGNVHNDSTSTRNRFTDIQERTLAPVLPKKPVLTASQLAQGYRKTFSVGESVLFNVGTQQHELSVTEVQATRVKVRITSTPIDVVLNPGEQRDVDVDADAATDISVKLERIVTGKAELLIQRVSSAGAGGGTQQPPGQQKQQQKPPAKEQTPAQEGAENDAKQSSTFVWVVVGFFVVLIILVVVALVYYLRQ